MFLGASLNPDYFNSKVNLYVALAPATILANIEVPSFQKIAPSWPEVEYLALKFSAYNLFNANWWEETAVQTLCSHALILGFCEDVIRYVADANTEVDDMDRLDVFLKDFPAGNGYQNLAYYAQSIDHKTDWLRYNYGAIKNMSVYGTAIPPSVPLDQLNVPTGLFIGSYDKLAPLPDSEWLTAHLNPDTIVWHNIYPLGHLSFAIAKDMSYFKDDVMNLINQYATNSFEDPTKGHLFLTN